MLEKIGTPGFATLSRADDTVLRLIDQVLLTNDAPVFYEVGIGIGATTLPVAERLANRGRIILFSRENDVVELASDMQARGFTNVDSRWGSPGNTYSGYHFELARGFVSGSLPQFDVGYLDGGHVLHLDAAAACVLKELCKPGGCIAFDDFGWSLARSPTLNPGVRPQTARDYDPRQIEACHVELTCRVVMDTDPRFALESREGGTAVYRKTETPGAAAGP